MCETEISEYFTAEEKAAEVSAVKATDAELKSLSANLGKYFILY